MTLLSTMKAEIADNIARSDLTSQIATAITNAIEYWKTTRFHFNETRSVTFTSVADQAIYTSADSTSIPLMFAIDEIYVTPSGGTTKWLRGKTDFNETHDLILVGASTGEPYRWSWFDRSLYFYPIPDVATYTFRLTGAIERAAPASDSEADNVWMVEAYDMIRQHALGLLYKDTIKNMARAIELLGPALDGRGGSTGAQYRKLRREATDKRALGCISPTQF
jgi:hypothetical protein